MVVETIFQTCLNVGVVNKYFHEQNNVGLDVTRNQHCVCVCVYACLYVSMCLSVCKNG